VHLSEWRAGWAAGLCHGRCWLCHARNAGCDGRAVWLELAGWMAVRVAVWLREREKTRDWDCCRVGSLLCCSLRPVCGRSLVCSCALLSVRAHCCQGVLEGHTRVAGPVQDPGQVHIEKPSAPSSPPSIVPHTARSPLPFRSTRTATPPPIHAEHSEQHMQQAGTHVHGGLRPQLHRSAYGMFTAAIAKDSPSSTGRHELRAWQQSAPSHALQKPRDDAGVPPSSLAAPVYYVVTAPLKAPLPRAPC
jgi:hypothetical protein